MGRLLLAALLSALVFPGLGQVYKGEVRKGVCLILTASLLLVFLVVTFLISYSFGYAELVQQAGNPDAVTPEQLRQLLGQTLGKPLILFVFGLLLAAWVYGWLDAARGARQPRQGV